VKVSVLGIDLGKNICSIVGLDASGTVVWFKEALQQIASQSHGSRSMARVAPLLLADYARVCASRNLARDMIEMRLMIRSFLFGAFIVLSGLATAAALADEFPKSDAAKIADALRAGPDFITKDATVLDWPSSPGGA